MKKLLWIWITCFSVAAHAAEPRAGQSFPFERLAPLSRLSPFEPAELKGHVTVVVFWASWCPYCKQQMSGLEQVYAKLKGRGLKVIGVNKEEDRAAATAGAKRYSFPQLYDDGERLSNEFEVRGIPVTFLVDKLGKVLRIQRGYSAGAMAGLPDLLERMLDRSVAGP